MAWNYAVNFPGNFHVNFFHHLNLSKTGAPENPPRNSQRNSLRNSLQKAKQDSERIRGEIRSDLRSREEITFVTLAAYSKTVGWSIHGNSHCHASREPEPKESKRETASYPEGMRHHQAGGVKKSASSPLSQEPQIALLFFCWVARVILNMGSGSQLQ